MAYQKPAGISNEEWAQTPPAVQALLSQSLSQANPHNTAPSPISDTVVDDTGTTVNMPRPTTTLADNEEGATTFMPFGSQSADDGGTAYMPSAQLADDGGTAYMPSAQLADDGGTAYRPDARPGGERVREPGKTVVKRAQSTLVLETAVVDDLWEKQIVLQNRYRLRRTLGKGGFGAAYLADDQTLERGCVVKQMLNPRSISPKELALNQANFEHEARLLGGLNQPGHPNIPEIFDYFSDASGSYLVMKYIEGQSLKGVAEAHNGKIPWQDAARYMIEVCSALNYMHTHGDAEPILHRDIKPDNILLGDDGRIWLVDFGLARVKPLESSGDLAVNEQAAGSVGYTPFEQWLGDSTPASDVYASGVTLHRMVTGQNPLDAYRSEDGTMQVNIEKLKDLHGQLHPIRTYDRKLPKALEEIISQATSAEPGQRLTALQFQQQLEVLVSGPKNAVLFTFKNGTSAKTIPELVDLCEQNRVEAQGYLYRGDFERWFTLINRNDLAEAAAKAVKHREKGKDGLEKFLKLIMPHIFWRRLGKASKKVAYVGLQVLLVVALAALIVIVGGTFAARWLLHRTIANYNWNYYTLELDEANTFSRDYLTDNARQLGQVYLEDIQVVPQAPDKVDVYANLGNVVYLTLPVKVWLKDSAPQVMFTQVNGIPLYWLGNRLAEGINWGIVAALQKAPIAITALTIDDQAVIVTVEKNSRVVWNPPTPVPGALPPSISTPAPTPTPPGQALLAVFNDLDQEIIIDIEGETWRVPGHDTKVIERQPGTYNYTVRYSANGQLAAQGNRYWTYKAYRWRIGLGGETFE